MADRHKPHNGRDRDGHFKVRQGDVDELLLDPKGVEYLEDDVRLGGAVEDTGLDAGHAGERIEHAIEENRFEVDHLVGRDRHPGRRGRRGGGGHR